MPGVVVPSERRWSNRAIPREVDRERARWLWGVFLAIVLAAAPFAAYLLEQNEYLRLSYEVSALRAEHERLLEEQRRLRMRRAEMESLDGIESWALKRYGLVNPSPEQVVVIRRGPPAGASQDAPQGAAPR